jgi:phage terminase small subunit
MARKLRFLTPKEEDFCQHYLMLSSATEAYRLAYGTNEEVKRAKVTNLALTVKNRPHVRARIEELRERLYEENQASLDELLVELTRMVRFDPADMYDKETGELKNIHKMPKAVRQMIASIDTDEALRGL